MSTVTIEPKTPTRAAEYCTRGIRIQLTAFCKDRRAARSTLTFFFASISCLTKSIHAATLPFHVIISVRCPGMDKNYLYSTAHAATANVCCCRVGRGCYWTYTSASPVSRNSWRHNCLCPMTTRTVCSSFELDYICISHRTHDPTYKPRAGAANPQSVGRNEVRGRGVIQRNLDSVLQVLNQRQIHTSWLMLRFHSLACSSGVGFFEKSRFIVPCFPPLAAPSMRSLSSDHRSRKNRNRKAP